MMLVDQNPFNGCPDPDPDLPITSSSSLRDVDYCCGSCGYELNLNSCNRNTSVIGSTGKGYGKSIKRGIISFFSIDETRFTRIEQLRCKPYFVSPRSFGLFQRRIKLLCRKCGNHVGSAYQPGVRISSSRSLKHKESPVSAKSASLPSSAWGWDGISGAGTYDIRIRALQPSSYDGSNIFNMI